jgi:hypothetical protein
MAEKSTHERMKTKMAGKTGKKEVPIKGGMRLDVKTRHKAVEIERSKSMSSLKKAATRLGESGKSQKVLVVPQTSIKSAREAMREVGVSGTVRNISGTKRSFVAGKKATPTKAKPRTTGRKK